MVDETSKAKKLLRKLIEVDKVINTISHGNPTLNQDSLASITSFSNGAKTFQSIEIGGTSPLRPVVDEGGRSLERHSFSTTRHAPTEKKQRAKAGH